MQAVDYLFQFDIKLNGKWVVYFDKYTEKKYGAIASTDLISWTDISDKVSFLKGVRHGTAFKVSGKEFDKMKKLYEER